MIEQIQIEAAKLITGAVKGTKHERLYADTQWQTLQKRRATQKIIQIHKMVKNEAPDFLSNLIGFLPETTHNIRYRTNSLNLEPIFAHTNLYYDSFLPSAIRLWNALDNTTKNESVNGVKSKLKWKNKTPSYYNCTDRKS